MRTTVDIEPGLLRRLRAEAERRGLSFRALLNRVLHRGLEPPPSPGTTTYRCPTFAMGTPAHGLDKALALADALADEETVRELARRK
jgi:hypothetical protein